MCRHPCGDLIPGLSQVTTPPLRRSQPQGIRGAAHTCHPGLGAGAEQEERTWGAGRGISALVLQAGGWSPGKAHARESREAVCGLASRTGCVSADRLTRWRLSWRWG